MSIQGVIGGFSRLSGDGLERVLNLGFISEAETNIEIPPSSLITRTMAGGLSFSSSAVPMSAARSLILTHRLHPLVCHLKVDDAGAVEDIGELLVTGMAEPFRALRGGIATMRGPGTFSPTSASGLRISLLASAHPALSIRPVLATSAALPLAAP